MKSATDFRRSCAVSGQTIDGLGVYPAGGRPKAYPNDKWVFFKVGIYMSSWKERIANVTEQTRYWGEA